MSGADEFKAQRVDGLAGGIIKILMMSTSKAKWMDIDKKVQWNELENKTLNDETIEDFATNPMIMLTEFWQKNKFNLYEMELHRLNKVNAHQPVWSHPNWSSASNAKINQFILENAVSREAVERWLVHKIKGKRLYISWKASKNKHVAQWIKSNKQMIIKYLGFIRIVRLHRNSSALHHPFILKSSFHLLKTFN
eukprot:151876_1